MDAPPLPEIAAFNWFGSKSRAARRLLAMFPEHTHYCEPYAGAATVLMAKPRRFMEAICDLDGEVVNFFTVLRDHPSDILRALDLTPYSRDEFLLAFDPTCDPLERARRFAVRCQQGAHSKSGSQKSGTWRSMLKSRPYSFARDWAVYPDRLQPIVERLQGVAIDNRPALDVLRRYDSERTLFYVDPPYMHETRISTAAYSHEMSVSDHLEMLIALLQVQGMVVLSGYASDTYDDALRRWTRHEFGVVSTHGKQRTEVVWLNQAATRAPLMSNDDRVRNIDFNKPKPPSHSA